jgi:hypothetical protein
VNPAFNQCEAIIAADAYVDLARLIWIVRVRQMIIPSDDGARFFDQIVNSIYLLLELFGFACQWLGGFPSQCQHN